MQLAVLVSAQVEVIHRLSRHSSPAAQGCAVRLDGGRRRSPVDVNQMTADPSAYILRYEFNA